MGLTSDLDTIFGRYLYRKTICLQREQRAKSDCTQPGYQSSLYTYHAQRVFSVRLPPPRAIATYLLHDWKLPARRRRRRRLPEESRRYAAESDSPWPKAIPSNRITCFSPSLDAAVDCPGVPSKP